MLAPFVMVAPSMQSRLEPIKQSGQVNGPRSVFRRDELLRCTQNRYVGAGKIFSSVQAPALRLLIGEGYLLGSARVVEGAPYAESLARFLDRWPEGATVSGYAMRWRHGSGEVRVTGLHLAMRNIISTLCDQAAWEFQVLTEGCDELLLREDYLNAWWEQ